MIFNPTTRRNIVLALFVVVALLSLLLSFSRNDNVNLAFTAGVFILIILFVQFLWRTSGSLVPFTHEEFKHAFLQSLVIFGLIMAARLLIFTISGDVWEKASMAILTILTITIYDRYSLYSFGLTLKKINRQLLWFLIGFGLLWVCLSAVNIFGPIFVGQKINSFDFSPIVFNVSSILLFTKYLLGNFAEEMFFRGFVQTKIKKSSNFWIALFIQATLFALYHINYIISYSGSDPLGYIGFYLVFTFIFGLVMGVIFELSGSIIATTLTHACYNMFFVSWYLLPVAKTSNGYFMPGGIHAFGLGLALIVCFIVLILLKRRKYS